MKFTITKKRVRYNYTKIETSYKSLHLISNSLVRYKINPNENNENKGWFKWQLKNLLKN